jgi:hypothetical protein
VRAFLRRLLRRPAGTPCDRPSADCEQVRPEDLEGKIRVLIVRLDEPPENYQVPEHYRPEDWE